MSVSSSPSPYPGIVVPTPGRSLVSRLMRLFMQVLCIPTVLIPLLALGYLYRQSLENEIEDGMARANQQTAYVEHFLNSQAVNTLMISQFPETRTLANATSEAEWDQAKENLAFRMSSYLRYHRDLFNGFHYVDIKGHQVMGLGFDASGEVIPHTHDLLNYSNENWFRGANQLASIHGKRPPVYFSHDGPNSPVRFSTVVINDEGILRGVLVLEMSMGLLLNQITPLPQGFFCTVVDENGEILYPLSPQYQCKAHTPDMITQAISEPYGTIGPTSWFPADLHQFSRMQPRGQSAIRWTFLYMTPLKGISGKFQNALIGLLLATFVCTGIALALVWWMSRQITAPILQLSTAAQDISHGHWDTVLPQPKVHDETYSLTVAFASMCRQLRSAQESLLSNIEQLTHSEKDLSLEKDRIAATLAGIGDAVIALDRDGHIQLLNPVAERMLAANESEVLNRHFSEIARIRTEDGQHQEMFDLLHDEESHTVSTIRLMNEIGGDYLLESSTSPIQGKGRLLKGWVLVMRDVREIREQAAEQNRLERLESLGLLAGGIAHDFNNLLAVILGDLSLLNLKMGPAETHKEIVQHAGDAAQKAKELTRQLMTFVRGGTPIKSITSLKELVEESTEFVLHGTSCRCTVHADSDLKNVNVDQAQMHQVFHNLALNAVQAMPEGGEISIHLENADLEAENAVALPEGHYIQVQVIDQGHGIPSEKLNRIFDPYFTTKGSGTGLGLCSVHNILAAHGGHIAAKSSPAGTTFTFYLPATDESDLKTEGEQPPVEITPERHLSVLVMDDEANIRLTTRRILELFGHTVQEAENGEDAIRFVTEAQLDGTPYDVVILDLTIPGGKGGRQVFEELHAVYPDLVAIVTSGYTMDEAMAHHEAIGFKGVIQKPFSLTELIQAVNMAVSKA